MKILILEDNIMFKKKSLGLAVAILGSMIPNYESLERVRNYKGVKTNRKQSRHYASDGVFYSRGRKRTMTAAQQKRAATKRANKRKHPRG